MRQVKLYRYQLPIQTGVVLRKQPLKERQGVLVCLQEQEKVGWGEIAPLPSFSQESLEQAENQAVNWLKAWQKGEPETLEQLFPSVAFGISCALAELNNELGEQANNQSAVLCYGDLEKLHTAFSQHTNPIGKIKIGLNPEQEGEQANLLLHTFPNLRLRLDANRLWSLEQAVKFAEKIANEHKPRIQFIEEPCQALELSRQFATQTDIAIAWDETVREANFLVKKEPNLTAIIIKPTLVGSLEKCVNLIQQAQKQGLVAVISSSLESSLGLTQLARIAQQYTPNSVPGLDTLNLMQHQLLRDWHDSSLPLVGLESEFVREVVV
ncbi:o-succinylbenzoate synthase [Mannheimia haemolytica]|uniref:o-succinylbenzoate synthase n=1 Tax=Mannheimia haemolytica TaxID=75985 RepID=UPI0003858A30|nr:o-succinylbenzoate synthase [Mannheimia haemolytica]EPZ00910.1 O-succinylbenzoate synthase [Mannheimia haemolytica D35]MDW1150410.1 o-succinylbenzoate synthase [Mannheimia haemolytica]MDW1159032.1 o-succinylbenzoate synthase [Mannheimia haemolytica]NBB66334.1 o-succinylbenzoate synthase [Mannheimia haemolytica]TRC46486.1 o-succinylbenzoate synthase [Mannheimia haemolytica]